MKVYAYARISTPKQNIERQVRNILREYPEAEIVEETYTGTKFQGRDKLSRLLKKVRPGDTIVFDQVSRMSRNAEEGFELYEELYNRGINLVFLKEPHINTDTYKKAMSSQLDMTGDIVDNILEGINRYLLALAKEQIRLAFQQAQKEVDDLHQRTKEGIETARRNGKQIGRKAGSTYETKRGAEITEIIRKHNRAFGGTLTDAETMALAHCCRQSYYKYKNQLRGKQK